MMVFQMLFKSVLGMLLGINAGAILGGLLGASFVGPQMVIGGMILGAMAGSLLGTAAGLLKSMKVEKRVSQPRPVAQAFPVRQPHSIPMSGD